MANNSHAKLPSSQARRRCHTRHTARNCFWLTCIFEKLQRKFLYAKLLAILFIGGLSLLATSTAYGAVTLTVSPITWNIIGLDSNSPATGPYRFPVGARVCNSAATTNVLVSWVWDSSNVNINLRPGSLSTITLPSIGAASCADAYFEVEVTQVAGAYDTARRYHIIATDSSGTASSPTPRELYVEHLISQNRNSITGVKLNGVSIPAGGTMTLVVGNTYSIELDGGTATQGYNQFEAFINFPNTIFQILSVSTTYSADSNTTNVPNPNSKLYADACIWDNDPTSPTYRSCIGGDDKAGGSNVVTTYTVKILSGGGTTQTLNTLLYDFSGSSFHYNADFSSGARFASIIGPASITIQKTFTAKAIAPGGTSVMSFKLTNPTSEIFTGVNFTDTLLGGLKVAGTPGVTTSGCGAGAFSPALIANATSLSFSGATLAANSICTVTVNVTAASAGSYPNTTGHLFINTSTDTGNTGSDTLTVSAASACAPGQTLARWSVPNGTTANPPDLAGGLPTIKASNVATATLAAFLPASTSIDASIGVTDTTSWKTYGYKNAGQYIDFAIDTRNYSDVLMSFYVDNVGAANGPTSLVLSYDSGLGFTNILTITNPANTFTQHTQDFTGLTSASGATTFRLTATGAANENSGAALNYDLITFTGCGLTTPAPTIAKSFSPNPIIKGATSTLTFTISNTVPGNQAQTGIAFSDVLPAGLSIANSTSSQCGGTNNLTTTAATRTVALTGGSLAAGGSCTFNVTVIGATEGQYDNVTGFISSAESGTSTNYATASLTVIAPPVLEKSFSPTSIFTGNTSNLSFTIRNPNLASSLSGISFTDPLPAGLTVTTSGPTSTCGGALTTTSPSTISFSGGSLAANSTCTFSVTITGATSGTKNNTMTPVTSTEGGNGNAASASLVVNDQTASLDLTKQVSAAGVDPWISFIGVATGSNVYYRFKIYNSGDLPFSALSVSDPTLASTSVDPATCNWAASLPLAPGDTAMCVKGPIAAIVGSHANTATAHGTYASGTKDSAPSTATYATTGLTIAKSATETSFTAVGNVLHYSYVVTNTGFAPLLGPITVADDKSTDETCPAVSTVGDGDNYLDPGESITCSATYTVIAGDVSAKFVTNTASATAGGVTSPTDSKTVNLASDLTAAKSNNVGGSVVLGNTFTWTVTVSNSVSAGAASFSNAQTLLTDDLPSTGATYAVGAVTNAGGTTGTINCAIPTNTLTCTASGTVTIPAGGSFGVPVTVTPNVGSSLVNPRGGGVCRVDPGNVISEIDETNNNCASNTVSVTSSADLSIAKSHAGNFTVGVNSTYTIAVTNNGPSTAAATILVTDTLPSGLSFVSGTGTGWSCSAFGQTVSCNNASALAPSAITTITLGVGVSAPIASVVTNTVTVTSPTSDPSPVNNTTTDPTTVLAAPDLQLSKTASSATVQPGGVLTYTLTYTNTGDVTANGVVVTETIPTNGTFTGVPSAWTCAPNNNAGSACTRSIGSVGNGVTGSITFTVAITNPLPAGAKQITNTATIGDGGTNGPDPTPSNNIATMTTPITGVAPDLGITKSDGGVSVSPGGILTYTLSYTNTGNIGASNVTITETVPANATFNAAASAPTVWSCANGAPAGTSCTLNVGTVAGGGGNGIAKFAVNVNSPLPAGTTQLSNTVSIGDDGANGADTNLGNNSGSDTTPIAGAAPDLRITKSHTGASVAPGGIVTFTLNYTNTGNIGATGVTLVEFVPANTTFTGTGWFCVPGNNAGSICVKNIGALNGGGASGSVNFVVTVANPFGGGAPLISNTANISDDGTNGTDPTPSNNTTTDSVPVVGAPDLVITKSDGGISVAPGGTITYSLNYTNTGDIASSGVVLTETVPANTTFTGSGWTCAPNNNAGSACTRAVGTIATNASGSATFAVTVANPLPGGVTQISNTARIGDDGTNGPDANPGNNQSTDTTPIINAAPDLRLTKTDGGVIAKPGMVINYMLVYTNTGNIGATGVVITETVPTDTMFTGSGWICIPNNNAGSICTRNIGTVAGGGGTGSVNFAVTVIATPTGSQIFNSAVIGDDGTNGVDPTPGNNTATRATSLTFKVYLPVLIKAAPPVPPTPTPTFTPTPSVTPTPSKTPTATPIRPIVDPKGMVSDGARDHLYLVNHGDNSVDVFQESTITTTNPAVLVKIGVGTSPFGIGMVDDKIYVANSGGNGPSSISVISAATMIKVRDIALGTCGNEATHLAVNPLTHRVYTTLHSSGKVAVIDSNADSLVGCVITNAGAFGIAVHPGSNSIFVGNRDGLDLWRINGATNIATQVVDWRNGGGGSPYYVGINLTTNLLFAMVGLPSSDVPNKLYVYSIDGAGNLSNPQIASVGNTDDGGFVLQSQCSGYIYIAETHDDTVRVLNSDLTLRGTIPASSGQIDPGPYGLLENATLKRVYVSNKPSNTLKVLSECPGSLAPIQVTATPTPTRTRSVTPTPTAVPTQTNAPPSVTATSDPTTRPTASPTRTITPTSSGTPSPTPTR